MEKERTKVGLGIVIIAMIMVIVFIIVSYVGYNNVVDKYEMKLEQQKQEFEKNNVNKEQIQEKIVEKGIFVPFDPNKVKDLEENEVVGIQNKTTSNKEMLIELTNENKVILIFLSNPNSDSFDELFGTVSLFYEMHEKVKFRVEAHKDYEVIGFDKRVVDVLLVDGNQGELPVVLFLIEDGTVEYLNLSSALKSGDFISEGKIEYLNNIVRIEQGYTFIEVDGYIIPLAIDSEGITTKITTPLNQE